MFKTNRACETEGLDWYVYFAYPKLRPQVPPRLPILNGDLRQLLSSSSILPSQEKMKGKNKLVPRLLGITKESVMRVDEKTKEVLQEWPLTTVKRWAASPKSFTLVISL